VDDFRLNQPVTLSAGAVQNTVRLLDAFAALLAHQKVQVEAALAMVVQLAELAPGFGDASGEDGVDDFMSELSMYVVEFSSELADRLSEQADIQLYKS
jgi:hypothetical protein